MTNDPLLAKSLEAKVTVPCHAELDSASLDDGYLETLKQVQGDTTDLVCAHQVVLIRLIKIYKEVILSEIFVDDS